MAEQITIPISIFELTTRYERPVLGLWIERSKIIQALFDTLAEFEPNADDLEPITTGKTSEQGVKLRLPSQRVTLFFGAVYCKFTMEDAAWAEADKILRISDNFLNLLTNIGGVVLGGKTSVLSLHLQPKTVPFKDILAPFMDVRIRALQAEPLKAMAIVAKWRDRRVTLDGSAQLANGIFVQMERDFSSSMSMDDAKTQIRSDELEMFKLLNIEEVV